MGTSDEAVTPDSGAAVTPAPEPRTALETTVADRLASVFDGDSGETIEEPTGTTEPETEETPEESGEASPEESSEPAAKPAGADSEKPKGAAAAPAAPILPDAHRRSLKAYGWQDTEIDEALASPGAETFLKTAERVHDTRNKEVAKWAELGRQARQPQQPPQTPQAPATQPAASGKLAIPPVDVEALREHYGDDEMVNQIVAPINKTVETINAVLPLIAQLQTQAQQSQVEALSREVTAFFGGKEMVPYKEVYGDGSATLTNEQIEARNKVLEMADSLIAGAQLQGRQLTIAEAMGLAHDSVSGGYKEKAARAAIAQTMQQRAKGVTLKPGTRKANNPAGLNGTRASLERHVGDRLKAVFT